MGQDEERDFSWKWICRSGYTTHIARQYWKIIEEVEFKNRDYGIRAVINIEASEDSNTLEWKDLREHPKPIGKKEITVPEEKQANAISYIKEA